MRLMLVLAAVVVAGILVGLEARAGDPNVPAAKATQKADVLTITLADNGNTVKAVVGQQIVVSLEGKEPGTGWEHSIVTGESVVPVKDGGSVGRHKVPPREFTPTKDAADEAMGTYTWRYKAVAEGETTLEYSYVSPGGPRPIERSATRLAGRMKVTIDVTAPK